MNALIFIKMPVKIQRLDLCGSIVLTDSILSRIKTFHTKDIWDYYISKYDLEENRTVLSTAVSVENVKCTLKKNPWGKN